MTGGTLIAAAAATALVATVPFVADDYQMSVAISILSYGVLATAWGLFSGPTRYVSLATVAFYGLGAYTVAVIGTDLPWWAVLLVCGGLGAALALLVGLSTLRLSGIYFVIFTFGLAELIRQLVTWYEVNVTGAVGRYVFIDVTRDQIYWQLAALLAAVFGIGAMIRRSRLGFALRVLGDDEVVAQHVGIDTTTAKVALFTLSATFMTLTGAVMAPRWTYIDPSIAFNAGVSFQVLVMALLGGLDRLWGPMVGVIPMTLLFEFLLSRFPDRFTILLGVVFLLIVYVVPKGVASLLLRGGAQARAFRRKATP